MRETREIRDKELPKLLQLYQYLHPDEDYNPENSKFIKTWAWQRKNRDFYKCYVVEQNKILIASCSVFILPNLTHNTRPFAVIENVVTHPEYRKKGYGRRVMEKAVEFARERKCYKVMLLSNSKRKEAHQFYKKLGFNDKDKIGFILSLK